MTEPLLRLKEIGKDFYLKGRRWGTHRQTLVAVDRVSLEVRRGETLGLVGESGSGKTTLGRMICRLETPSRGELTFAGHPLHRLNDSALRPLRKKFQPIFQDPFGSLNPRLAVRQVLAEPLRLHAKPCGDENILALLETVGLGAEILQRYPHQLSGGQRQRLVLARALAVDPELLVADEPVSSLDVSIQAQILNLFLDLQQRLGLTLVFISHDLRVVGHLADRTAVLYMGRIMEIALTADLFARSRHPYTWALMEALPRLQPGRGRKRSRLSGDLPTPIDPAPGCRFYSRCRYRDEACRQYDNELLPVGDEQFTACRRWQEIEH